MRLAESDGRVAVHDVVAAAGVVVKCDVTPAAAAVLLVVLAALGAAAKGVRVVPRAVPVICKRPPMS